MLKKYLFVLALRNQDMGIGDDIMLSYCLDCDHIGKHHHPLDGCNVDGCECSLFTINPKKKPHKVGTKDIIFDDI